MMPHPTRDFFHKLAGAADRETLSRFRLPIQTTSKPKDGYKFDPVTEADREAEIAIRKLIEEEFPTHAILGEELGESGEGPYRWVLDPIDGTRPFLLGIPVWGTLIGFCENGRATAGIMSQPVTRERFLGLNGEAWLETETAKSRLQTSTCNRLSDAILHTNSPEGVRNNPDVSFSLLDDAVKMTRYGGECYSFAMLAAGRIDICVEFNLQPYDIVPLVPLIEFAGGVVTTFDGARPENGGRIIATANEALHEAVISILKSN